MLAAIAIVAARARAGRLMVGMLRHLRYWAARRRDVAGPR
jgi:hypothetical protein